MVPAPHPIQEETPLNRPGGSSDAPRVLRLADPADAAAVAALQLAGWKHAYAGILPAAAMEALSIDRRERSWRDRLARPPSPAQRVWVLEDRGRTVGFVSTRPSLDPDTDPGRTIEIHAVYVRPDLAGRGLGRALLAHAAEDARRRGFDALTLWVAEGNIRARRFYEAAGMAPDGGRRTEVKDTASLMEVRYRCALATLSKGTS